MKLQGDLQRRLRTAIQKNLYRTVLGPDVLRVREMERDGRAEVLLSPPGDSLCVEWKIQSKIFGFLTDARIADGAFFVLAGDDTVEAHIIECKRTVTQDAWSNAKQQMRSTLLRLRALAGVLGVEITRAVCYTAFCEDELSPDSLPEPAELKIPVGDEDPATPMDAIDLEVVRRQFDWEHASVHLPDLATPMPHRKLLLNIDLSDGMGKGTFSLGLDAGP
jgi:hypothetical protein